MYMYADYINIKNCKLLFCKLLERILKIDMLGINILKYRKFIDGY